MDKVIKELVCIGCPNSCRLTVKGSRENPEISGNRCPKGAEFAKSELTCPMRCLTSTVLISGAKLAVLPVRTDGDIPKSLLPEAMKEIAKVKVEAPVKCGDTVLSNLLGTGVRLMATESAEREEP